MFCYTYAQMNVEKLLIYKYLLINKQVYSLA